MTLPEYTEKLISVLEKLNVPEKERLYRHEQLEKAEKLKTKNMGGTSDRYYQLAHEIKSLDFLSHFGSPQLSSDFGHKAGADIVFGEYQIECVCASPGSKTAENGFDKLCTINNLGELVVYNEREDIILTRLTSVLKEKRDFFIKHCNEGSMSKDKPYIIFIGLGSLAIEFSAEENGMALLGILFGKGRPTITIDASGNIIGTGYEHRTEIKKQSFDKTVDLPCNYFLDEEYRCVSGIIFSEEWYEDYDLQNTWLFINPFSDNPINTDDFPGLIYWNLDEYGNYRAYGNEGLTDTSRGF